MMLAVYAVWVIFMKKKLRRIHVIISRAFEYHQKAAEQGSANSYNQLGNFYSKGAGVEKNTLKAEECYRKAIQLYSDDSKLAHQKINLFPDYHAIVIYSHATYNLGTLLLVKDGGSSDYWREAISLLLKSEEARLYTG